MSDIDSLLPVGARVARALLRARRLPALSLPRLTGAAGGASLPVTPSQLLAAADAVAGPAGLLGAGRRANGPGALTGGSGGTLFSTGFATTTVARELGRAIAVSGGARSLLAPVDWGAMGGAAAMPATLRAGAAAIGAAAWPGLAQSGRAGYRPWWTGGARAIPAPGLLPSVARAGQVAGPNLAGGSQIGWAAGVLPRWSSPAAGAAAVDRAPLVEFERRLSALERRVLSHLERAVVQAV